MGLPNTTFGTAGNGKPLVAAFDLASKTGVCLGRVGEKHPEVSTWELDKDLSRPLRLLQFSNRCDEFLSTHPVDYLCYEAPLELAAAVGVGSSEDTQLLLRGLIGVLECCGARASVKAIQAFNVKNAREHLTGYRTFKKGLAKDIVWRTAEMLGVKCDDDNQADAYCGWSYACSLLNPRIAHLVTPLWSGQAQHELKPYRRPSGTSRRSQG